MKAVKLVLICLLCVPMGLCITLAYLLGMLVRYLNDAPELDPYDGPGPLQEQPNRDGSWFL